MCTEPRPIRSNYMGGQVYFSLPYSTPPLIDNKSGQGVGGGAGNWITGGRGWEKGRVVLHLPTHSHPSNTDNVQILIFNSDLGLNKYGSGFPFEKKFAHLCSIFVYVSYAEMCVTGQY